MQLPLFYTGDLIVESDCLLSEETSRHICQVLRMHAGEQIQLTDGKGILQTASILEAHKKHTSVKILSNLSEPEKVAKITIAISPLKNLNRFEWFLEKATEIGVHKIIPFKSARSERFQIRHDRMKNILISAMLQSRQTWLPELAEMQEFKEIKNLNSITNKYIAHCLPNKKEHLLDEVKNITGDRVILIGPEGDFNPDEIELAIKNNFKPVTLGNNRLRTETAGIAACVMLNAS